MTEQNKPTDAELPADAIAAGAGFTADAGPLCVACGKCRMTLCRDSFSWKCGNGDCEALFFYDDEAAAIADAPRLNARAEAGNMTHDDGILRRDFIERQHAEAQVKGLENKFDAAVEMVAQALARITELDAELATLKTRLASYETPVDEVELGTLCVAMLRMAETQPPNVRKNLEEGAHAIRRVHADFRRLRGEKTDLRTALRNLLGVISDSKLRPDSGRMRFLSIVSGPPEFFAIDAARIALATPAEVAAREGKGP